MKQRYEIVVREHLTPEWAAVFEGMEVISLSNGNTRIAGDLADQADLYGMLMRLRDLGITLISLCQTE